MTDTERIQQEKDVLHDEHRISAELQAHLVRAEAIADGLDRLARAFREHPEAITGTPSLPDIEAGRDYREDLALLDRQGIVEHCKRIAQLQQDLRTVRSRKLRLGL